ncbi:unnamed protein product [Closterium sp. NIES-54]
MGSTFGELGYACAINVAVLAGMLVAYTILSKQPLNARVYFTKWFSLNDREAAEKYEKVKMKGNVVKRRQWLNLSLRSYRSAFSWVDVALAMPERELIAHAGLDNVVFLHALKLGFKIFGPILIVAAAVLVPVNYLGGGLQQQAQSDPDLTYSDIDMLSIANIPNQSSLLWVHVAMAWLFNAWALYMMRLEHRTVADMRLDYLADQQRAPNQFTVLVRQVPKHPIKTVPEHVDHFFSVNHRGHYLLTQPVYNANRVARLEKKRGKLENKLTELHIKLERFPNKPLTVRMGFMGLVGEKVDAIQHYQDKLEEICDEIIAERERVISDPASTMPAAFVSFSSRWGAAVAAQTLQSKNSSHWITQWAPEQRDVKWSNLPIPYEQLAVRRVLVLLAAAAIVFFYTIPVGFVQSLANLDKISRYLPWLQPILSIPVVNALITDILSGLALKIFMALLPYLLIFLASLEGHVSLSQIDLAATGKYFWFIIGTVFVTNVMGGALISATHDLSEHTTRGRALSKVQQDVAEVLGGGGSGAAGEEKVEGEGTEGEQEGEGGDSALAQLPGAMEKLKREVIRDAVLGRGSRADGRGLEEVRQVACEAGVLNPLHGSSLFSRGNTQVGSRACLGAKKILEGGVLKLFYASLLFSHVNTTCRWVFGRGGGFGGGEGGGQGKDVGKRWERDREGGGLGWSEAKGHAGGERAAGSVPGRARAANVSALSSHTHTPTPTLPSIPSSQSLSPGTLAEKALLAVFPDEQELPYSVRVTSEVMSSDGSSSMATVCGASLALMDAGVGVREHVAGISMGLVTDVDPSTGKIKDYRLLTDILSLLSFLTPTPICLLASLPSPPCYPPTTPLPPPCGTAGTVAIDRDSIGRLIGPQGSTIKQLQRLTGSRIQVSNEGSVSIFARDSASFEATRDMVEEVVGKEVEVGGTYTGVVSSIRDFGAFVELEGGRDGLLHISEIEHYRVSRVEDVLKVGDTVTVSCISRDARGNVKLSRKALIPLRPSSDSSSSTSSSFHQSSSYSSSYTSSFTPPSSPSSTPQSSPSGTHVSGTWTGAQGFTPFAASASAAAAAAMAEAEREVVRGTVWQVGGEMGPEDWGHKPRGVQDSSFAASSAASGQGGMAGARGEGEASFAAGATAGPAGSGSGSNPPLQSDPWLKFVGAQGEAAGGGRGAGGARGRGGARAAGRGVGAAAAEEEGPYGGMDLGRRGAGRGVGRGVRGRGGHRGGMGR